MHAIFRKWFSPRRIYLDFAASTPILREVEDAMAPFWRKNFASAGALHAEGRRAEQVIRESRSSVARVLSVKEEEIIFTGGGTETNNLVLGGFVRAWKKERGTLPHIIVSAIEHASILETARLLEQEGVPVSFVEPDHEGRVLPSAVMAKMRPETALISVMLANNEIGVVEPVRAIAHAIGEARTSASLPKVFVHTDASQAPLFLDVSPHRHFADYLTLDGQKIGGPKGVGMLFKNRTAPLAPILCGGSQEFGLRPGTENTPLIVGFAKALLLSQQGYKKNAKLVTALRDYFLEVLRREIPDLRVNGSLLHRIAGNVNVTIPGFDHEYLAVMLDQKGVACSTKSACLERSGRSSHVLRALYGESQALGALRFSLSSETTRADLQRVARLLGTYVRQHRKN